MTIAFGMILRIPETDADDFATALADKADLVLEPSCFRRSGRTSVSNIRLNSATLWAFKRMVTFRAIIAPPHYMLHP